MQCYVFVAPWGVRPGTGVNNSILGLAAAMRGHYAPEILVTGWVQPDADQRWIPLPNPAFSFTNLLAFVLKLPQILWKLHRFLRGAVVNPHYPSLECLPLAMLRRMGLLERLVFSFHGSDVSAALRMHGWQRAAMRWMLNRADAITACSGALAEQAQPLTAVKVTTLHNGCSQPSGSNTRPLPEPYIVCVAAYTANKGHAVLLDAYEPVAQFGVRLVLIGGDGPERAGVTTRAAAIGVECHVNMPQEQVWNWMKHSECLVLASYQEGFGLVLLEAAQLRTPVVATRVGGIPEFVEHGVHGLLVEPGDAEALSEAILATLSGRGVAERVEAFYRRAQGFTWDATFLRLLPLLEPRAATEAHAARGSHLAGNRP